MASWPRGDSDRAAILLVRPTPPQILPQMGNVACHACLIGCFLSRSASPLGWYAPPADPSSAVQKDAGSCPYSTPAALQGTLSGTRTRLGHPLPWLTSWTAPYPDSRMIQNHIGSALCSPHPHIFPLFPHRPASSPVPSSCFHHTTAPAASSHSIQSFSRAESPRAAS